MKLSIASVTSGGADRIVVVVEISDGVHTDREKFLISTDIYTKMKLCRGQCDIETYECLQTEAEIYAAFNRALYILGYGACSKKALIHKLVHKGFTRKYAEQAAERAEQNGYIDDKAAAARTAELMAEKLWGAQRIRAGLAQKGYDKSAVDYAMYALEDSEIDFEANCLTLLQKKCDRLPEDRKAREKLTAALMRYGYTISQIKWAYAKFK